MQIGKFPNRFFEELIIAAVALVVLFVAVFWLSLSILSFESLQSSYLPSDAWILDSKGYPLESIRTKNEKRSLEWVAWNEVSPVFSDLLIRTEDKRFYSHFGVDFLAIANAVRERAFGKTKRGASTLTMQLVALLSDKNATSSKYVRRSYIRKVSQIITALKLERSWKKDEILEAYINLIPFRGELVGLRAASVGYFAKNPAGLNSEESALLIALLRSPNASASQVSSRACKILAEKNCAAIEELAQKTFSQPYRLPRSRELVPVLSQKYVTEGWGTSIVRTSLDFSVQELVMQAMREQLQTLKSQNVHDAAVLVMETKTGNVLAYGANAGAGVASKEQIDGIQMRRQAGSTIKPFVYATAFDWKLLKPNSLLEDSPADISVGQGRVYHPKNYDKSFRGLVSASEALGSSMNVPTVRALRLIGESRVLEKLRSLGFENLKDDDYYGPSLALGSIDVSLWELTNGYRQFATEVSAFTDETRKAIFNILASPENRRYTFGMDSLLSLPFAAAAKTGTSKDMRDNWCIGWTDQYTVGVWVGNFNGEPMWNVSGMSGAAPIWRSLMLALNKNPTQSELSYENPAKKLEKKSLTRIRYPADDMMLGLDPDIPEKLQKMPIEVENPRKGDRLFMNAKLIGVAGQNILWPVKRGKYKVELKTAKGEVSDIVKFEVR